MTKLYILCLCVAISGCDTLNSYGIGGAPQLLCRPGQQAVIDDKLLSTESFSLSVIRKFEQGNSLCKTL